MKGEECMLHEEAVLHLLRDTCRIGRVRADSWPGDIEQEGQCVHCGRQGYRY